MRLLIYASLRNSNTVGSFFIRNFDGSVDYEILRFPDQFADLLASKVFRAIYRFFPAYVVRKMDESFLHQVREFKPTTVLIFKGMEISSRSLIAAKNEGVKLVNYNFDHPFDFFSRGTGNRFVRDAIPAYDLHISYSSVIAQRLASQYRVNTSWIPFGFHITEEQYAEVINANRPEINRACFVGNPDRLRVKALKRLMAEEIPLSLYGFGWEDHFAPSRLVEIHPPRKPGSYWADPNEFWKVIRQYRIQLNFFRPHNEGSHNLRTFEVPAVGGILLTPESGEQRDFFDNGTEIFSYSDEESLVKECRRLLSADEKWVAAVRERARQKSVSNDYSYSRRTKDLLAVLRALENG